MDLAGRTVAVVGLGRSGRAAAKLALAKGAQVVGVDGNTSADPLEGARLVLGEDWGRTLLDADVVVMSPGVPPTLPPVAEAIEAGVDVVGELGFAARFVSAPVIAITGTNGKSTVTSFVGTLCEGQDRLVFVGGNLGTALSEAALGPSPDLCVVEVSSYQLQLAGSFAPEVAVVLNLTPDHLARHGTMEAYGAAKVRVFQDMPADGVAFLPRGDTFLRGLADGVGQAHRAWIDGLPGVVREGEVAHVQLPTGSARFDLSEVEVPGAHNLDHAATAAALAFAAGVDADHIQARLPLLQALPHRMQPVHEADGVVWIDDSKATNLASTAVAIAGLDRAAVVLLGGQAKAGGGFANLAANLQRHRAVITFGGSGAEIADELDGAGATTVRATDLADAVRRARNLAREGDAVLLSPACASFDAFSNFEHRGRVFAALARQETP